MRLQEGMYIATLDGKIIDANPAFLEMFGAMSVKELRGFHTSDFLKAELRAREMDLLGRMGSIRDVELQLTRPDGEVRTVVDSAISRSIRRRAKILPRHHGGHHPPQGPQTQLQE